MFLKRDNNDKVLIDLDSTEPKGKREGILGFFLNLINPIEPIEMLYNKTRVDIINIIISSLLAIVLYLLGANITTVRGILIVSLIYCIYNFAINIITKANLALYEYINILFSGMPYLILSHIMLLLTNKSIYPVSIIIFIIILSYSFIIMSATVEYFCSANRKLMIIAGVFVGIILIVFNTAVGIKTFYRQCGIEISNIETYDRNIDKHYRLEKNNEEGLNSDYNKLFGSDATYGNMNKDGNLTERLPSTVE